jgi:hypothetical protein
MTSAFEPQEPPYGDPDIVDGGGYLYVAGELLVHQEDAGLIAEALAPYGVRQESVDPLLEGLVVLFRVPTTIDMPGLVEQLREQNPDARVQLNHVWAGERAPGASLTAAPKYHGGPGDAPVPAGPPAVPNPVNGPRIAVAVVDTGLARSAVAYRLFQNRIDVARTDYDEVYVGGKRPAIELMGGHGTMVAGLIARYAPTAQLLSMQVLNSKGYGSELRVLTGLAAAVSAGAGVINMSLGGYVQPGDAPPLLDALLNELTSDVSVVAAAGNDGRTDKFYPASHPRVVSVGAVDTTQGPNPVAAPFSNAGPWVKTCAPGVRTHSAYVTGSWDHGGIPRPPRFDGYALWSGTSFATAHVSAAIANRSVVQGIPVRQAERDLLSGGRPTIPGYGVVLVPPY